MSAADYMRDRRRKRRIKYLEMLGGKCANCGETDPSLLEFDHKNPRKKQHDFNEIKDGPENTILKEVKKCGLLCIKCHLEKTKKKREHINRDKKPARHGTLWMYKKYKCRCDKCKKSISEYMKSKL